MEMQQEHIRPLKDLLVSNQHPSAFPPRPLLQAILTLIGEAAPVAGMGIRLNDGDDAGRWMCVVLTEDHVVYAEAAREGDARYEMGRDNQDPTELSAKMWRRDAIVRTEVRGCETHDDFGSSWRWRSQLCLVMSDGEEIPVPPDGQRVDYSNEAAMDNFTTALRM